MAALLFGRIASGFWSEMMLTYEEQEAARMERLSEAGTEPPCPFCQRPRVSRTDYIRCNPCGTNWLDGEMHLPDYLNVDPRVARQKAARMAKGMPPTAGPQADPADEPPSHR